MGKITFRSFAGEYEPGSAMREPDSDDVKKFDIVVDRLGVSRVEEVPGVIAFAMYQYMQRMSLSEIVRMKTPGYQTNTEYENARTMQELLIAAFADGYIDSSSEHWEQDAHPVDYHEMRKLVSTVWESPEKRYQYARDLLRTVGSHNERFIKPSRRRNS